MLRFSPNPNRAHLIPWFEWEGDAFRLAREEDKPVMVFLSAFWCRYCQRMDEEAFSETENIALLKAYFISLRVENAQRPDVDARYNFNGWPTIAFLSPTGRLLTAVNFLPPEQFKNLLLDVYMAYQRRKDEFSATVPTDEAKRDVFPRQSDEQAFAATLAVITDIVWTLADRVYGGYGSGQKFIQTDANEFLLKRYETTGDSAFLDHVCLTLDRMREGAVHDRKDGGYFRTTTRADWSEPHREKLLIEQAGLLANCLGVFRITRNADYAQMAAEIVGYLNRYLFDPKTGAFHGCEDFLRSAPGGPSEAEEFFSIVDECIYVDANAGAISAYLDAAAILQDSDCRERALAALEYLWAHCRSPQGGIIHFSPGAERAPRLLVDQSRLGLVLIQAHGVSAKPAYLEWAEELGQFVLSHLTNPAGGYYDVLAGDTTLLGPRLTLIEANGPTASFFLSLGKATNTQRYFDGARWALCAFTSDVSSYGLHAASFGKALDEYLCLERNHG